MTSKIGRLHAIILLTAATSAASSAIAEPPRWVVRDADSELVLFPTIHALPEDLEWKSEAMLEQLAEADEVWFEIDLATAQGPEMQQRVMQQGMDPERPLSSVLGDELHGRFAESVDALGLPIAQLDPMRPWLASITLTNVALAQAGFSAEAGVEARLRQRVEGRELRALETAVGQIDMLAGLPEPVQIAMLESTLEDVDGFAEEMRTLAEDWAQGDVSGMETLLIDEMAVEYPALYDAVFTQRNRRWVEIIEDELAGSGTDFIAVGAGHLVGDDSVVEMLRARGWTVTRIERDDS
jgi:hypothetical protein